MSIENKKFNIPETINPEGTDEALFKREQEKRRNKAKDNFYFDLVHEAIELEESVKEAHSEKPESQVHDLQFYFKKTWDRFIEPLHMYEYEELKEQIQNNKDISNSERKRQLRDIEERRINSESVISKIAPEKFHSYSKAQKRAWLDQIYRGMVKDLDRRESNRKYLKMKHRDYHR